MLSKVSRSIGQQPRFLFPDVNDVLDRGPRHAWVLPGLAALALATAEVGTMAARAQPAPLDPVALAGSIQQRYDGVRDFSAEFVHAYQGGVLRKTAVERGTVRFKKPGMMRWVYTTPERKEFVSDGNRLYAYVPEDRQVTVSEMPPGDQVSTPVLFLAGRGHLVRDFVASAPAGTNALPETVSVTLTSKRRESDFEWMTLEVDRTTFQIRGLTTADAQGGRSSFTFAGIRENRGLRDTDFRFIIPRGVDVITNNPSR
jgi:outer membrane lipoprotein carrier protein